MDYELGLQFWVKTGASDCGIVCFEVEYNLFLRFIWFKQIECYVPVFGEVLHSICLANDIK